MKIHHNKKTRLGQYGTVLISCHDTIMADILGRGSPIQALNILLAIRDFRSGKSSYFEYCLRSGAKLKVGNKPSMFYIYAYASDGHDGIQGIDELQTLDAVRIAIERVKKTYEGAYKVVFA